MVTVLLLLALLMQRSFGAFSRRALSMVCWLITTSASGRGWS